MNRFEYTHDRNVAAKIVRSADGGPLRQMVKGRSCKPIGTFVALKAGNRAMPWESMKCELPVIELSEVASPVLELMSQPHRLELHVRGKRRPLVYFPDLELKVDSTLYAKLNAKVPFAKAMLEWRPSQERRNSVRNVVVEIKDDADPRNEDREYQRKLRLAASVYRKIGIGFVMVLRSRDINCVDLEHVHDIALERFTTVSNVDVDKALQYLNSSGQTGTLGELVKELGGYPIGWAKAAALHVRRVISLDISQGVRIDTAVSPLKPFFPSDKLTSVA